jgi:MFS family permease
MFFATQAITVLHWSRLSDVVGRKPIILIGLFGLSLSMFSFGLSTTYWGAALWHVSVSQYQSFDLSLIIYPAGV